jgi:hypothetical protein
VHGTHPGTIARSSAIHLRPWPVLPNEGVSSNEEGNRHEEEPGLAELAFAVMAGLLIAGGARPAEGHRTELTVEIVSVQASLAPDGRSMSFQIEVRCDRKWTIVDARVSASQPQASGEGTFTPICNRLPTVVGVTVPATGGSFQTVQAQVSARLVVRQASTKAAGDFASVRVRPSVGVSVGDRAVLEDSGRAVRIDVTVTCPMTSTAQGGQVAVFQYPVGGRAAFGPTPCDGLPHTQSVKVAAAAGLFQLGSAEAEAFTSVEEGGDIFPGAELRTVQIVTG